MRTLLLILLSLLVVNTAAAVALRWYLRHRVRAAVHGLDQAHQLPDGNRRPLMSLEQAREWSSR